MPARRALADFRADRRLLMLAGMAILVGTGGAFAAWVLLKLIALVTNLVWFGRLDTAGRCPWPMRRADALDGCRAGRSAGLSSG